MLVQILNIENIITKLPRDRIDALIKFDDLIYEMTVGSLSSSDATDLDKHRSYFIYMQEFIRRRGYNIVVQNNYMKLPLQNLKTEVMSFDAAIKKYIKPHLDNRSIEKIRSSMADALAYPDGYIVGVLLDQPTKAQIRQYVEKVKETVENSGLSEGKQEALLRILNEFLEELDKEKTRLERWAEFYVLIKREAAAGTEWALNTAERAEKIWSSLTKGKQSLPAPERGGDIEAPQKKLPAPEEESEEDAAD